MNERKIVTLIAGIQFVNVLDFMMVMPLGPDFAHALHIPTSSLGLIGGSYTAAAALAGVLGSMVLDRFNRRKALLVAMLGLVVGTFAGAFASDLTTLILARIVAGAFGGPATAVALSIVTDVVPAERRGRAMGTVMGAFSLASIFGVPVGLELASWGGWRLPFIAVGGLAFGVTLFAVALLPRMTGHLKVQAHPPIGGPLAERAMLKRPEVLQSYLVISLAMLGSFMMVPNISTYFQYNLGFPREHLGQLYFWGGLVSLFAMKISGRLSDRFGPSTMGTTAAVILILVLFFGYFVYPPPLPLPVIFTGFMVAMSIRGVAANSLSSRVPRSTERARFMSLQGAVNHSSCALGAFFATLILTESSDGRLLGMSRLVLICAVLTGLVPIFMFSVERKVRILESSRA